MNSPPPRNALTKLAETSPEERKVSVVICTVDRPALLRKAVASVVGQTDRVGHDHEIVVVDNSPDGRWRALVEELASCVKLTFRYVGEPRAGFAFARNAGIREAAGAFVAFLDDDEEASPDWLDQLVGTMRHFNADVVFGPVLPAFEGGRPPSWDPDGRYHTRDLDVPTGSEVGARGTGNVLIRRATCLDEPEPFAHDFGASGGEDTDFFMRLRRRGRKLVWCATARVTEVQPENCLSLAHRGHRVFCQSQVYVRVEARNAIRPNVKTAYLMAVGAAQTLVFSLPGLASWLLPKQPFVDARLKLCIGLGKLFWMVPSSLYRKRYE